MREGGRSPLLSPPPRAPLGSERPPARLLANDPAGLELGRGALAGAGGGGVAEALKQDGGSPALVLLRGGGHRTWSGEAPFQAETYE